MELFGKFIIFEHFQPTYVILEIIPPRDTKQSPLATEQFLTTLHSLGKQRSFIDRLLFKKKLYALEVVSMKEKGIRFLVRATRDDIPVIKKNLLSFLPGVKLNHIKDYLPVKNETTYTKLVSLTLKRHFIFSLQEQKHLSQHDPIAYITGQMTKLAEHELVAMQYVLTPTAKDGSKNPLSLSVIVNFIINCFLFVLFTPFTLISSIFFDTKGDIFPSWIFNTQKKKDKKEVVEKLTKDLFEVTIRLYVMQNTKSVLKSRLKGLITSFAAFRNDKQELQIKKQLPFLYNIYRKFYLFQFKNRLLALSQNPILSVSELAGLFHFPYSPTTQTEDLVRSNSKQLAAPLSLKQNKKLDVVFANNHYAETITSIGLTQDERRRHMYVIGATGTGKTTLLATMIREDIKNGKGVCVIDPHGNLIEQILPFIPELRIKDTILFDPDDTEFPIGLNLLALPKNVTERELQRQKEFITSNLISIIMKLYPPRYTGPRMEYILRNVTLTALETEAPTLFTIQRLLVDNAYRKQVIVSLKNPILKLFWTKEFQHMGSYQKAEAVSPITNKIGKFITSSLSANILGQKESKLDFSDIIDHQKILLCDLSKGKIGEDFSSMFGVLITAGIQLAALKRVRMPENKRKDFYLYIDEFQNFANPSFAQVLSEARKYRLNAILAHQTIAQIEDKNLVKVILANTGSIIAFRTGSPMDEEFILPFFAPLVEKGEIANLPLFNFYMKVNSHEPQNAFSGETMYQSVSDDKIIFEAIKDYTRSHYALPREKIEEILEELSFVPKKPETDAKQKMKREVKIKAPMEELSKNFLSTRGQEK